MTKVLPNIFHLMAPEFSKAIGESFKELLENKHLYQNSAVVFPPFETVYKNLLRIPGIETIQPNLPKECQIIYDSAPEFEWELPNQVMSRIIPFYQGHAPERVSVSIEFTPPTIKAFCPVCENIHPYNFINGIDVSKDFRDNTFDSNPITTQIFLFAYECQSCKSLPEVFMIRREKMKLIQSGRTPMEQIEAPKFLPKAQRKYFSDAIIAFNSGQILAGKFLLRTFIEQYIRDFTKDKTSQNTDELFEKYGLSLPDDFKQRFPSLASIYSQLSVDIHSADSTIDLFIQAQKDIQKHFEAKRLFEIS